MSVKRMYSLPPEDQDKAILAVLDESRSMHDILRELVALRALKEQWKEEVSQLRDRLEDEDRPRAIQRERLAKLDGLVKSPTQGQCKTLPRDVLHLIFDEIFCYHPEVFPCTTLDGSLDSPFSKVRRMQKALILVCKDWHRAALPFLYRYVVLPSAGQVLAFSDTLRSSGSSYGADFVRSLSMYGTVPDRLATKVNAAVSYILSKCSCVRRLSFDHTFVHEAKVSMRMFARPIAEGTQSSIQENILAVELRPNHAIYRCAAFIPRAIFSSFVNFKSLSITADYDDELPILSFPRVETLILWLVTPQSNHTLPARWNLPKLKDIRFRPALVPPLYRLIDEFFATHGQRITHLDFGCRARCQLLDVEKFVGVCPVLKHLVVSETYASTGPNAINGQRVVYTSAFSHRPLEFIDIGVGLYPTAAYRAMNSGENTATKALQLPWKSVRSLEVSLVDLVPELAHLYPPESGVEGPAQVHDIFDLVFVQTKSAIYQLPLFELDSDLDSDSDVEDGNFVTEDSEEDSDDESVDDDAIEELYAESSILSEEETLSDG